MIVAAHQPLFLPWLGYFDRMRRADLFVVLDHVQFARRNYQNRTQILLNGRPHWLTVPVQQLSQQETIVDKLIATASAPEYCGRDWAHHVAQTLRQAYRKAPYLERYGRGIGDILRFGWSKLVDLDLELITYLRGELGIATPMVRSSELKLEGSRSELILNLCKAVGADAYFAGMGGSRRYLDREAFAAAGIEIVWQNYVPSVYAQAGNEGAFTAGLSSIDLLMNYGPNAVGILDSGVRPHWQAPAEQPPETADRAEAPAIA